MDDLYVAAFQRAAERELEKLKKALSSDQPLHQIWQACIHTQDNRLVAEFTALANRSKELRAEVAKFIKKIRRTQNMVLMKVLKQGPIPSVELTSAAIVMIANSVALALARENSLGITDNHAAVESVVAKFLAGLEPPKSKNT
jgi:hypothetical protein